MCVFHITRIVCLFRACSTVDTQWITWEVYVTCYENVWSTQKCHGIYYSCIMLSCMSMCVQIKMQLSGTIAIYGTYVYVHKCATQLAS